MKSAKQEPKVPSKRRGAKRSTDKPSQPTTEEFEREGMGVAPKE
jgi:hypothetical protein